MSYLLPQEEAIVINPKHTAQAAVIWMHGLGASGHDFASLLPQLKLDNQDSIRFIFPHAPEQAVTINGGIVMPSWYDILKATTSREINTQQFHTSVERIQKLIDSQIDDGVDSKKIILAGFSQGGAVAYHAALTYPKPLAGLLALSTYIADDLIVERANLDLTIEIFHGTHDQVVPIQMAKKALAKLIQLQLIPRLRTYEMMGHELCLQQVEDLSNSINSMLP